MKFKNTTLTPSDANSPVCSICGNQCVPTFIKTKDVDGSLSIRIILSSSNLFPPAFNNISYVRGMGLINWIN